MKALSYKHILFMTSLPGFSAHQELSNLMPPNLGRLCPKYTFYDSFNLLYKQAVL